jgi:hypothetical protein
MHWTGCNETILCRDRNEQPALFILVYASEAWCWKCAAVQSVVPAMKEVSELQVAYFNQSMKSGVGRVYKGLDVDMPLIAAEIQAWMKALGGTDEPADYFLHPIAFPLMLLPWWLERRLKGENDADLQTDLIFSNASLYYYIRMVDNVMDGHATVEHKLLPAAGYFISQFQTVYHDYFDAGHPFWDFFKRTWAEFCDVTAADGRLTDIDQLIFANLVGHKVCAAKISVAAVCFHYGHSELLALWNEWIDIFGCWHLFREDMFDWRQDLNLGAVTYFLSEAKRRKRLEEPEISWIAREGLDWGIDQLKIWMGQLRQMPVLTQEVSSYLDFREKELFDRQATLRSALKIVQ